MFRQNEFVKQAAEFKTKSNCSLQDMISSKTSISGTSTTFWNQQSLFYDCQVPSPRKEREEMKLECTMYSKLELQMGSRVVFSRMHRFPHERFRPNQCACLLRGKIGVLEPWDLYNSAETIWIAFLLIRFSRFFHEGNCLWCISKNLYFSRDWPICTQNVEPDEKLLEQ